MPLPVLQMPKVQDDIVILAGGLNLTTPSLKLKPGHVRRAQNWQCVTNEEGGGYERIGGYERYNGGTAPSSITYSTLVFSDWINTPSQWNWFTNPLTDPDALVGWPASWENALIRGVTSGAIGKIAYYVDATTPEYYVDQNYVVVTSITGTFQIGEAVVIPGADIAGNIGGAVATVGTLLALTPSTPVTGRTNAKLLNFSTDMVRNFISFVPGSGKILGVVSAVFAGVRQVYAVRNVADGTAAKLYKTAVSEFTYRGSALQVNQWVEVPLNHEVRFTAGGTTQPAEGTTLTKGGVTATIKRVVTETGSWGSSTAAGRFIIDAPVGGNFSAGAATIGIISVTLSGAQTAITLLPNGVYQFDVANFSGQLTTRRIYGADGVNRAFEFDGTVFVPIETKATQDTPKFIRAHHLHLCVGIGSSLMISAPGSPYKFGAAAGGMELATGDEVTGLLVQPGNQDTAALAVFGRNSSGVLYGTSVATFNYKSFTTMTGSLPYIQANLDQSYVFDDRGVMSVAAAQEYGNFRQATVTADISDFLIQRKSLAVGCCVSTDRSQFRIFFSDGSALYLTVVNGQLIGALPQQFFHPFSCVWSAEDASGNEETFAGGTNGYVYQLDRGPSFDGEPIEHYLFLNQNYMGAPGMRKQFRNGVLEIQSNFYAEFAVGYRLSYGSDKIFQPVDAVVDSSFQVAPTWDTFVWDQFFWDGVTLSPSEVEIKGKSEAIQMVISGYSDYVYPFRLSSLLTRFNYTRRGR